MGFRRFSSAVTGGGLSGGKKISETPKTFVFRGKSESVDFGSAISVAIGLCWGCPKSTVTLNLFQHPLLRRCENQEAEMKKNLPLP